MSEHRLGCLRMVFRGANAGAMRGAQHHRTAEPALRSIPQPRRMVHELIDARIEEPHELDLADRFQPLRRHADAESADQRFRQRRVKNALAAKALL